MGSSNARLQQLEASKSDNNKVKNCLHDFRCFIFCTKQQMVKHAYNIPSAFQMFMESLCFIEESKLNKLTTTLVNRD